MECPRCGNEDIVLSRRRRIEKIFSVINPKIPFRCRTCWERFWARPEDGKNTAIYKYFIVVIFGLFMFAPSLWYLTDSLAHPDGKTGNVVVKPLNCKTEPIILKQDDHLKNAVALVSLMDIEHNKKVKHLAPIRIQKERQKIIIASATANDPDLQKKKQIIRILKRLSHENREESFALTLWPSMPVVDFKAFFTQENDIPKLMIDLAGQWEYNGPSELDTQGNIVVKIHIEKHPDKLRIALDLKDKTPLEPLFESSDRFLILLKKRIGQTSGTGVLARNNIRPYFNISNP